MSCKHIRSALLQMNERSLNATERAALDAHLATCPECQRFATAMQRGTERIETPDLTERVMASVRPLPPPWVFEQTHQDRHTPQLVAFAVGALGVAMAFVSVAIALVVGVASGGGQAVVDNHTVAAPLVGNALHEWANSIPSDRVHTFITLVGLMVFAGALISWFRTLALHTGHDH